MNATRAAFLFYQNVIRADDCERNALADFLVRAGFFIVCSVRELVNVNLVQLDLTQNFALELVTLVGSERVRFSDKWNDVDLFNDLESWKDFRSTLSWSLLINSMSSGFKPWPVGAIKYRQQWTRVSWILHGRSTRLSPLRKSSNWLSINSIIGSQHLSLFTSSPKPGVSTTLKLS